MSRLERVVNIRGLLVSKYGLHCRKVFLPGTKKVCDGSLGTSPGLTTARIAVGVIRTVVVMMAADVMRDGWDDNEVQMEP